MELWWWIGDSDNSDGGGVVVFWGYLFWWGWYWILDCAVDGKGLGGKGRDELGWWWGWRNVVRGDLNVLLRWWWLPKMASSLWLNDSVSPALLITLSIWMLILSSNACILGVGWRNLPLRRKRSKPNQTNQPNQTKHQNNHPLPLPTFVLHLPTPLIHHKPCNTPNTTPIHQRSANNNNNNNNLRPNYRTFPIETHPIHTH